MNDTDLYLSAIYLFCYLFLFGLGIRFAGMFLLLSGMVGIFFSLELLRITGSIVLTTIFMAISIFTTIFGVFRGLNSREGMVR